MKNAWLYSWAIVGLLGSGCRSVGIPVLRTNFPGNTRLKAYCAEYLPGSPEMFEGVSGAYDQGWRIAYVSEFASAFLVFSTAHVQICYEKSLDGAAPETRPAPQSIEAAPKALAAPKPAPGPALPPPVEPDLGDKLKAQLEQNLGAQRKLLTACVKNYGKDQEPMATRVTVEPSGAVVGAQIAGAGSSLVTCVQRLLKMGSVTPFQGPTMTVELAIQVPK